MGGKSSSDQSNYGAYLASKEGKGQGVMTFPETTPAPVEAAAPEPEPAPVAAPEPAPVTGTPAPAVDTQLTPPASLGGALGGSVIDPPRYWTGGLDQYENATGTGRTGGSLQTTQT
jgi:hypothetical protein